MSFILTGLICMGNTLATMESPEVSPWLEALHKAHPALSDRVLAVAQHTLGTPYADGPLGEGPDGTHDTDPKIDLSRVDCVTFVEQTVALAASQDYDQAYTALQAIRYRDGVETYEGRNHFFVSDWLRDNPWCREITGDLVDQPATVARTISRRDFFQRVKATEFGQNTPDEEITLKYIPMDRAADAESKIPRAALITFIGKIDWLFALHCGLYLRDASGVGHLYHASSKAGEVVKMPLAQYLEEQSTRYLGFAVHELNEPEF